MNGAQLDVKWGLEGVSASHNLLEKTVIAVPMDTITTLSASVSFIFSYHKLTEFSIFTLSYFDLVTDSLRM